MRVDEDSTNRCESRTDEVSTNTRRYKVHEVIANIDGSEFLKPKMSLVDPKQKKPGKNRYIQNR